MSAWVHEPAPKGLRWLFLPTLALGLLASVGGAAGFVRALTGASETPSAPTSVVIAAFGLVMVAAGAFAVLYRARFTVDRAAGTVTEERRILGVWRSKLHSLDRFDRVELRRVRGQGSADQPGIGPYVMVWLAGPGGEVHVDSDLPEAAEALGEALADATGRPLSRGLAATSER